MFSIGNLLFLTMLLLFGKNYNSLSGIHARALMFVQIDHMPQYNRKGQRYGALIFTNLKTAFCQKTLKTFTLLDLILILSDTM